MRVGVLTGLRAEARLLRGARADRARAPRVFLTGACSIRARHEAERLVASGAIAVVSFGVAGGLDPRLSAGDLVLADRVIFPDGSSVGTDRTWVQAVWARLRYPSTNVFVGPIAGTDHLIATVAEKRQLAERSGALAGDMESGAAAAVAAAAGLPLLVVRAVSDSASQALPSVARLPVRADGRLSIGPIAHALCAHPREWRDVARLALGTRAALASLRGVVRAGALLPPGSAFDGVANDPLEHELRGTLAA
jgi:adenosylhomocysteine nucleosidase